MQNELFDAARESYRQNDVATAHKLFQAYVTWHPNDPDGWLWLSRVASTPEEKLKHLRRVLEINPQNRTALSGLLLATRKPGKPRWRGLPGANAMRVVSGWLVFLLAFVLLVTIGAATVPMFMGYRSLVVMSGSMEPTIPAGAVVIAAPVPSAELKMRDIIVFNPGPDADIPFVHRIVRIRKQEGIRYYTTRGDANRTRDTAEISLAPTAWRVAYSLPWIGYIVAWATSSVGFIMLIAIPLVGLILLALRDGVRKLRTAPGFVYGRARS